MLTKTALSKNEKIILLAIGDKEICGILGLKDVMGLSLRLSFSLSINLYYIVHELQKKELVTMRIGGEHPLERGGARNTYYRLTNEGKEAVKQFYNS